LQKWLADNGYAIRPAVSDALGPYVRGGWSFVAMRLTSTAPIVGGLSPVRMTFQSSHVIFPVRLSVAARTDADATGQAGQSSEVQFAGNVSTAARDQLLHELAANHGGYVTKIQVNIPTPSQISSDFTFGNAPSDDAYRQVVYVDRNVAIPIELILFAAFVFAVIVAMVAIVAVRSQRRQRAATSGPMR
jgi:hypothetical protein